MRFVTLLLCLTASHVAAQDSCESRCNQQASECLKTCAGDTKTASKPESGPKLLGCLKACDAKALPCRADCKKPK